MIKLACKICGNDTRNTIIHAKERMLGLGDPFDYLECSACGCVQLLNIPADMRRYYPGDTAFQFWGSEQYLKGIPLIAENSYDRSFLYKE